MALPTSLPDCAERLQSAEAAVAKTQGVVRVVGGVALAFGIGWAIWELVKHKSEPPAAEPESEA